METTVVSWGSHTVQQQQQKQQMENSPLFLWSRSVSHLTYHATAYVDEGLLLWIPPPPSASPSFGGLACWGPCGPDGGSWPGGTAKDTWTGVGITKTTTIPYSCGFHHLYLPLFGSQPAQAVSPDMTHRRFCPCFWAFGLFSRTRRSHHAVILVIVIVMDSIL